MADEFKLVVPLDASGIEGFKPDQAVKVVVVDQKGAATSQTVQLDPRGTGSVTFQFSDNPGAVRVLLGPESVSDEEMQGMQTIAVDVAARQFQASREVKLTPVRISAYYWHWWPLWCRTFTISGRVLCADGQPVPGAKVCAYDVDFFWWWRSVQQITCATTDATGSFQMRFRWCCGWLPWWWWRRRYWQFEPALADKIAPVLQRDPKLPRLPVPTPDPDPSIFERLLAGPVRGINLGTLAGRLTEAGRLTVAAPEAALPARKAAFDPSLLSALQERLARKLPPAPELERLQLWPWWPWQPWLDCNPDIIFRVTQDCRGADTVIVDENVFQTRWNVPVVSNVTLTANSEACCIPRDPQQPQGDCIVISTVCSAFLGSIGGNPGAPAAPAGYFNPGAISNGADRPWAGSLVIEGLFGSTAHADYYEFEWSTDGVNYNDMPPAAAGGFSRMYWGPQLGGGPVGWHTAPFTFNLVNGRNVVESREHFEATHDPASWGVTRFWVVNRDVLMVWLTENNFADRTYYLRVKSYAAAGGGIDVNNPHILPLCDTNQPNGVVLTIDNRVVGPGSMHPTSPDHPCGGLVHLCTREPDTDIIAVRVNGQPVGACANIDARNGGVLEIDFMAHDPDGHLESYSLIATYGENLAVDLLAAAGATLNPGPPAGVVPPAAQMGPGYAQARMQGAAAPTWEGGTFRLTIPNLRLAFPETCCYQLELRAYKRTIVSCNYDTHGSAGHANLSEYSFTVVV
jgi:hypothetical protein